MSIRQTPVQVPQPKAPLTWNDLTETEKSAAALGVDPTTYRPIAFLNTAHYETLLKDNRLDDTLAKQLEAYKTVAKASGVA